MPPGTLMAVTDHINFTGVNPLFNAAPGNERFVDMIDAYDPVLVAALQAAARSVGLMCHDGVYVSSAARASRRRPRSAPRVRWAATRSHVDRTGDDPGAPCRA